MAVFGHSGSQAEQLMHSSVIIKAIFVFLQKFRLKVIKEIVWDYKKPFLPNSFFSD
jgi:hypothetical protein